MITIVNHEYAIEVNGALYPKNTVSGYFPTVDSYEFSLVHQGLMIAKGFFDDFDVTDEDGNPVVVASAEALKTILTSYMFTTGGGSGTANIRSAEITSITGNTPSDAVFEVDGTPTPFPSDNYNVFTKAVTLDGTLLIVDVTNKTVNGFTYECLSDETDIVLEYTAILNT